jgi:hypothetical protein
VKSGSTFEALRASEQLAKIARSRRKSFPAIDQLVRDAVESAAEASRHNAEIDVEKIVRDVKERAGFQQ